MRLESTIKTIGQSMYYVGGASYMGAGFATLILPPLLDIFAALFALTAVATMGVGILMEILAKPISFAIEVCLQVALLPLKAVVALFNLLIKGIENLFRLNQDNTVPNEAIPHNSDLEVGEGGFALNLYEDNTVFDKNENVEQRYIDAMKVIKEHNTDNIYQEQIKDFEKEAESYVGVITRSLMDFPVYLNTSAGDKQNFESTRLFNYLATNTICPTTRETFTSINANPALQEHILDFAKRVEDFSGHVKAHHAQTTTSMYPSVNAYSPYEAYTGYAAYTGQGNQFFTSVDAYNDPAFVKQTQLYQQPTPYFGGVKPSAPGAEVETGEYQYYSQGYN